jgi:hypothetical protein
MKKGNGPVPFPFLIEEKLFLVLLYSKAQKGSDPFSTVNG